MSETRPSDPGAPARRAANVRLPWALVAILSVAVLGLTGLVSVREREVADLQARLATTVATATAEPSTPGADASQVMKSLPRRESGDARALGRVDAPVVMINWSDFRCPFCALWARTTFAELKPYVDSGSLRIEFRDLVLFGEQSRLAAIASRAAAAQGRFWQFSDALFAAAPTSGHPTITAPDVVRFARQAGVKDIDRFREALDDPVLAQAVDEESAHAQTLGISGTPFFVVNTTPISGAQSLEAFTSVIEGYGGHR